MLTTSPVEATVRVRVHASSINYRDCLVATNVPATPDGRIRCVKVLARLLRWVKQRARLPPRTTFRLCRVRDGQVLRVF